MTTTQTRITYPGPGKSWENTPLGLEQDPNFPSDDLRIFWRPRKDGNLLIGGPTGHGKTVLLQIILSHALGHPQKWQIYAIDPMNALTETLAGQPTVRAHATTLSATVDALRTLENDVHQRMITDAGGHDSPATLLAIDSAYEILESQSEDQAAAELRHEATHLVEIITQHGPAVGVYTVVNTQRPALLEIADLIEHRIAVGPHDRGTTHQVLGGVDPEVGPLPVGRAAIQPAFHPEKRHTFQIYTPA